MIKRLLKTILILLGMFCGIIIFKYILIINHYKEVKNHDRFNNWTATPHPFFNSSNSIELIIDKDKTFELKLWWESLTGYVEVNITDDKGNEYFTEKASHIRNEYVVDLKKGNYHLDINIHNFTGAISLGYKIPVVLPKNNFTIITSNPSKGFYWEYILYIPDEVKHNNLLVMPNNTGTVSDNIDFHREEAKTLILDSSKMAKELGIPLIVPVFPRPANHEELYTQALDRATILTNIEELKRLDLQLIAMIEDAKKILSQKGINLDEKILMSGFSASGNFTDRFTFLHPEIVKAAFIGGSENIIPCKTLNGENLPYPIGIYDYKEITGKKFDINVLSGVYRFIYKGSKDEGGWNSWKENGKEYTYTGKEYYEKFKVPQLIENSNQLTSPIYSGGDLSAFEQDEILFRAYKNKILLDRFLMIKSIFNEKKLDRNKFIVYEGVDHSVGEEIKQDEVEFFREILEKQ